MLQPFSLTHHQCPWYGVTGLLIWLLSAPELAKNRYLTEPLLRLFQQGAKILHESNHLDRYVNDTDRQEEFIRTALMEVGYKPIGETDAQATDRLTSVSTAQRLKLIQAARNAEQRSRKIRQALARQKAKEAADKYTRE